jgi:hypothetical protein
MFASSSDARMFHNARFGGESRDYFHRGDDERGLQNGPRSGFERSGTYNNRHDPMHFATARSISQEDSDLFEKAVPLAGGSEEATVLRGSDQMQTGPLAAEAKEAARKAGVRQSGGKEVEDDPDCKTGRSTLYFERNRLS